VTAFIDSYQKNDNLPPIKKAVVAFLHGGYWLIYLSLLALILGIFCIQTRKTYFDLPSLFPLLVLFTAPNLVSFYAFYFWLFTGFLSRRKIFALIVFGVLICLTLALAGAFLSAVFFGFEQAIFADWREFIFLTTSLFVIAAIHGIIALVIRGFIGWFGEVRLKEELARKISRWNFH
jgi:two-component system, LytTR family, sensor kinase